MVRMAGTPIMPGNVASLANSPSARKSARNSTKSMRAELARANSAARANVGSVSARQSLAAAPWLRAPG